MTAFTKAKFAGLGDFDQMVEALGLIVNPCKFVKTINTRNFGDRTDLSKHKVIIQDLLRS